MPAPHPITWTPSSIARFWGAYESNPGMDLWHFSKQRGKALLHHVRKRVTITDPVLDLGCGSGYLLDPLLKLGHRCFGADVNARAIEMVISRFCSSPLFLGGRVMQAPDRLLFDDCTIGTVFLLETIEHLLPESIDGLFIEINRILAPGGSLIITAPYQEYLDESVIACPACAAMFHKTQHLRSFDEPTLSAIMKKARLTAISCGSALLLPSLLIWLKAQLTPARTTITCPECGTACQSPNRSIVIRWKGMVRELRHLAAIGKKE
jgi:SAM-dependent methyltransferase